MADSKRRMVAILCADVVGYSRLMDDDERATVDMLNACRSVFRDQIDRRDGRVVDTAGDSILAVFESVVESVQCAVDVQRLLLVRNADLPPGRRMQFRIGVNFGDVITQDDGTVYGNGVNVAARLEGLADPGGVCVSAAAQMHADGKVDVTFADFGAHSVKNIDKPVQAYKVDWAEPGTMTEPTQTASPTDQPSIAVLPFADMSGDPEQAFFADGITEDIITELGRFRSLMVIARNSSFVYKNRPVNVGDIGRELGAAYVVEGSVRKSGDRLRVTAQLVEAASGKHVWADRYDRALDDVFALQDEITQTIVSTLAVHLEDAERARSARVDPTSLSAYECCLRGKNFLYEGSKDSLLAARQQFEKAIEIEPTYAAAYVDLGETYYAEARSAWTSSPQAATQKVYELARTAIKLDPHDSRAHLALAFAHYAMNGDLELATTRIDEALRLNPNDFDNHCFKGWLSTCKGELDAAVACSNEAFRRSPLVPDECLVTRLAASYLAGDYAESINAFDRMLRPDPNACAWVAAAYAQLNRTDAARSKIEEFVSGVGEIVSLAPLRDKERWTDYWAIAFPSKDPAARDQLYDGLRKAGLPI